MTASKAKGTRHEVDLINLLRADPYEEEIERLALVGTLDQGDAFVLDRGKTRDDDLYVVIECKNRQRMNVAGAVDEAKKERDNFAKARDVDPARCVPIAVIKRRGKPISEAFVVTTVHEYFRRK